MEKPRNQALTYKGYPNVIILNGQSAPHLRASFTKINDTNINYNIKNLETDLVLLWNNLSYKAKTAQSLSVFKSKFASLPSAGSYNFSSKLPPT